MSGPKVGAQRECPPAGFNLFLSEFMYLSKRFYLLEIVLNDADDGKGEQLRAGKPRKEDEELVNQSSCS